MHHRIVKWTVRLVVLGVLLAAPSGVRANRLANPGFETPDASAADLPGVTGWTEFGEPNTRFVTQRTAAHGGSQCLKMFGPWTQWAGTGMSQAFPAAEGQTWVAEIWSYNSSADPMGIGNYCVMKIEFLDGQLNPPGGTWLAGVNVFEIWVADENTPKDVWQQFGVGSAPAPAGTAYARFLIVEVQGRGPPSEFPASGGSVFLDDAYFDPVCARHDPVFDLDDNQKVDVTDLEAFNACVTGPAILLGAEAPQDCVCMDLNGDRAIDQQDFGAFQLCFTGPEGTVDPACDD